MEKALYRRPKRPAPPSPGYSNFGRALIQKCYGLNASNLKAFTATQVLAHDHIVATDHVRLRLGELGAVALVGASGELLLLGPHQA